MFSVGVHLSVHRVSHVTITNDTLDLTIQEEPIRPGPKPPDIRPGRSGHSPLLMTSGGDHWRPVQTCSFGDPPKQHLVVATENEANMVSKQTVCFLKEYFLVLVIF